MTCACQSKRKLKPFNSAIQFSQMELINKESRELLGSLARLGTCIVQLLTVALSETGRHDVS